jgi:mono/diheme cytochrome c family protein
MDQAQNTATAYFTDNQVITRGEALFENKCSACHNFLQKGIGPGLRAVTTQVPASWITNFVRNAPAMIQSGDSRAVELFGIYNQYMPPFTDLSESDLQAIVSYIHANRQNPSTAIIHQVINYVDFLA